MASRSIGVSLSAVFLFLISLLSLACGTLTGATILFGELPGDAVMPWMKYFLVGYVFFILVLTVWEMVTAIGLFWLQPWARISILVAGGLMIFFGLTSLPVVIAFPFLMPEGFPERAFLPVAIGLGGFYLAIALVGGWWIYLFTRKSVYAQFEKPATSLASAAAPRRPSPPLSISVIAWLLLLTCWMFPAMSFLRLPVVLLGKVITGVGAVAVDFAYGFLLLYIGLGLLKRQRLAHTAAVCYFVFAILNALVFAFSPSYEEINAAMNSSFPEELQMYSGGTPLMPRWLVVMLGLIPSAVPLWFLVTRRKTFLQPEA